MSDKSVLALVTNHTANMAVTKQPQDPWILPAGCTSWMLVQKMSAGIELHLIDAANKVEVSPPFSKLLGNDVRRQLRVIQVDIQLTEGCTGWRPYHPCWLAISDEVHCKLSVRC